MKPVAETGWKKGAKEMITAITIKDAYQLRANEEKNCGTGAHLMMSEAFLVLKFPCT